MFSCANLPRCGLLLLPLTSWHRQLQPLLLPPLYSYLIRVWHFFFGASPGAYLRKTKIQPYGFTSSSREKSLSQTSRVRLSTPRGIISRTIYLSILVFYLETKGKNRGENQRNLFPIALFVRHLLEEESIFGNPIFRRVSGSLQRVSEDSRPIKQLCLPSLRTRGGKERLKLQRGFIRRGDRALVNARYPDLIRRSSKWRGIPSFREYS